MVRPKGTNSAKVIQVIETKAIRGTGEHKNDPVRVVTQYWGLNGTMLAENDPDKDEGFIQLVD